MTERCMICHEALEDQGPTCGAEVSVGEILMEWLERQEVEDDKADY